MHDTGTLAWEVVLPGKHTAPIGACKPKGVIHACSDEGGEEYINVPKAVGRMLARKQKSGELVVQTREELLAAIQAASASCARYRIERLIDRREYAQAEIRQKLLLDGYTRDIADECIAWGSSIGLISNARYADMFIRSKISAGWGVARIERELSQKGVDPQSVVGWPYDYLDPEDELTRARELAERHHVSEPRAYEKMVRFLCGRGFSLGVATQSARVVLEG